MIAARPRASALSSLAVACVGMIHPAVGLRPPGIPHLPLVPLHFLYALVTLYHPFIHFHCLSPHRPSSSNFDDQDIQNEAVGVWFLRILMDSSVNAYITFMDNDTISGDTRKIISDYRTNYTFTYQDYENGDLTTFFNVLGDLMKPTTDNARYIMALCGMTFICLASMNLIQSWPRDRFHWASIISRYAMGTIMMLLLLLNVGKYQTYFIPDDVPISQKAAFLNWIDVSLWTRLWSTSRCISRASRYL